MLILRTARETSRSCEPNYIDFVFRILPHNYQFVKVPEFLEILKSYFLLPHRISLAYFVNRTSPPLRGRGFECNVASTTKKLGY